jgi:hypothetical protein
MTGQEQLGLADDVFEAVFSLVVSGLLQMAPRPCGCRPHEPQPARTSRP